MIRINDHLFQVESIHHIWIETDGNNYVIFVDMVDKAVPAAIVAPDRANAEAMLDRIQDEIERYYDGGDMIENYT